MQTEQIKQLVIQNIAGAEVFVKGEDCNFQLTVISDFFADLSAVKRQQLVYANLSSLITDGALHAVTIKAYTPGEWQAANK